MEPPHVENFREPLLFLTIAGVIVPLSRRLHISPVIGFLIAGVFVGDHVMGELARRFPRLEWAHLHQSEATSLLAEMGVVFLLFMIGLELSFERLARLKALVFGLGAAQVLSATTVLAALGGWVLGLDVKAAVVLGAALSLSSTAIVIPTLAERHKLGSTGGRAIFSVLLFQDLMVAPLLFIVAMLVAPKSRFARFHANQGLILCIAEILRQLAVFVLWQIPYAGQYLGKIGEKLGFGVLLLMILGVMHAARGENKRLPLIGNHDLLR